MTSPKGFKELFEEKYRIDEMGLINQLKGKTEKEIRDFLKQKYGMTPNQIEKVLRDKKIKEQNK